MIRLRISLICLLLPCWAMAQTTLPTPKLLVAEITPPTEPWKGWETGLIDEDPSPTPLPREVYTEFPTPSGSRPTFSGRVVGLDSYNGVEIAIVSVFPREYLSNPAYEWVLVRSDGSFAVTSSRLLDRPKTLLVRPPGGPWTYLRHDFPIGASARDIELRPQAGKTIHVTARLQGGPERAWMSVEAFDAYQRRDDQGSPAMSAYYGGRQGVDGRSPIILPLRPVALRVRTTGSAAGYVIFDPREVDEVSVQLPPEGRLRARITHDGQVVASKPIWIFNPFARLSLNATETDNQGNLELRGLMPGPQVILLDNERAEVYIRPGDTVNTTLNLKD